MTERRAAQEAGGELGGELSEAEVEQLMKEAGIEAEEVVEESGLDRLKARRESRAPKEIKENTTSEVEGKVAKRVGEGEATVTEEVAEKFTGAKEAPQKSVKEAVEEMNKLTDEEVRAIADSGTEINDNQSLAMIEEINRSTDAADTVEKVTNLSSFATSLGRNVNYIKELYKTAAGRTMKAIEQYKQLGMDLPEGFADKMLKLEQDVDELTK